MIEKVSQRGGGWLDGDTYLNEYSFEAALYSAGAGPSAAEKILAGKWTNAFCLVRPPGHHALAERGMGFCLFNNISITARRLQHAGAIREPSSINKIAILDWDVHHGNGTQEIFYDDPSVLFISFHRWPFYPGAGSAAETGAGKGKGFTVNIPVTLGTTPREYIEVFRKAVEENLASFKPDFVLISAGFDSYKDDPIAGLGLEVETFAELTEIAKVEAKKHCGGRLISFLEGGYNLEKLPECIEAHLKVLMGQTSPSGKQFPL